MLFYIVVFQNCACKTNSWRSSPQVKPKTTQFQSIAWLQSNGHVRQHFNPHSFSVSVIHPNAYGRSRDIKSITGKTTIRKVIMSIWKKLEHSIDSSFRINIHKCKLWVWKSFLPRKTKLANMQTLRKKTSPLKCKFSFCIMGVC